MYMCVCVCVPGDEKLCTTGMLVVELVLPGGPTDGVLEAGDVLVKVCDTCTHTRTHTHTHTRAQTHTHALIWRCAGIVGSFWI